MMDPLMNLQLETLENIGGRNIFIYASLTLYIFYVSPYLTEPHIKTLLK